MKAARWEQSDGSHGTQPVGLGEGESLAHRRDAGATGFYFPDRIPTGRYLWVGPFCFPFSTARSTRMELKQAIRFSLEAADFVVQSYLKDLTDAELLVRPVPGANHIAWQLGHLIAAESYLADKAAPGKGPALPAGFADKHKKDTAGSDDPKAFLTKEEYLRLYKQVREGTLALVEKLTAEELQRPTEKTPPMVKTAWQALQFIGAHWAMHAGQWAVTRRKLGRAPLF